MDRPELLWRNFWLMIRRAPRDRRTWRPLLLVVGALAYVAYDAWAAFYIGLSGVLVWLLIMALAVALALLLARSYRRTDQSIIQLSTRASIPNEDLTHHRPALVQALFSTAALVDRAGIELMHRQGRMNPAFAGRSRQRTLELVRTCQWDELTPRERELLQSPEGTWSEDDIWAYVFQIETVRVLRWTVGTDPLLVPLEFAELDLRPALEITTRPPRDEGTTCVGPADLRVSKLLASQLLDRLVAEGAHRGFYQVPQHETRTRLIGIAERMRQTADHDHLVGVETVAEASEQRIRFVTQTAFRRIVALASVITYLTGPTDAKLRIRTAADQTEADQPISDAVAS